jgi:hypothetical protein
MDSAERCLVQAEECRRQLALAQSKDMASILKNIARSWVMIAGQIDRYAALMRDEAAQKKAASVGGLFRAQKNPPA